MTPGTIIFDYNARSILKKIIKKYLLVRKSFVTSGNQKIFFQKIMSETKKNFRHSTFIAKMDNYV